VPAVAGTYTYTWYKDGIKMAQTTPTITVTTPGVVYTGMVTTAAGCSSTVATKTIAANVSDLPVLTWVSKPASAVYGAKVTLQTAIEFGPAVSYTWTADSGAVVTGSGTNGATLTVKVTAVNSCGKSVEISTPITMNSACLTPVVTAQSNLSQTVTAGSSAVVSVSVSSGVNPTYQWYSNATNSTTGGTAVGTSSASYTYTPSGAGTTYFYCIVTNGCGATFKGTSPVFTVIANANPATLPTGAGTFSGKVCFDIAESNDGGSCGPLSGRTATKADFNQTATNTQTYTFTPSGAVSKIRFAYVESLGGAIVKSITNNGSESALNVSANVTATVVFKNTLSSTGGAGTGAAFGKTTANALSVDLYVIYNNKSDGSGTDVTVKLTAKIQDCACCGAYIAPAVFKTFMCHNLGADTSLDPMVANPGLVGDWYMYGLNTPSNKAATPAYPPVISKPLTTVPVEGRSKWGDTTGNVGKKTATDPCPAGYRVPTSAEWSGVLANNTRTNVGTALTGYNNTYGFMYTGVKFGNFMMLPSGGIRGTSTGSLYTMAQNVAAYSMYWSSTSSSDNNAASSLTAMQMTANYSFSINTYVDYASGMLVRCISEN